MSKAKKRPSKNARAAEKLLKESKLLAAAKVAQDAAVRGDLRTSEVTPRTSTAIKPRPHKKRG